MPQMVITQYADGRIEEREMTAEEIAQREADAREAEEQRQREEAAFAAREAALTSARAKLAELGLTEAEIAALRNELIEL